VACFADAGAIAAIQEVIWWPGTGRNMMAADELPDHLNVIWEWEILRQPLEFASGNGGDLPYGIEKVRVFRAKSDYGLHFETIGGDSLAALMPGKRENADLEPIAPPSPAIVGLCSSWRRAVRMDNPHFAGSTHNAKDGSRLEGVALGQFAHGRGSPGLELLPREDDGPAASRSYWFAASRKLGRGWSLWPRGTEREQSRTFRRIRDGNLLGREATGTPTGSSQDCASLTMNGIGSVVVASVPKEARPDWFEGIEVEHALPPTADRAQLDIHQLAEALGFVLGAPLVPLGRTDYDSTGRVHSAEAWHPRHADVMRVTCEIDPRPPCRLSEWGGRHFTESLLQTLVPAWFQEREKRQLRTVSYLLHYADVLPIDIRLVLYMAIIETLAVPVVTAEGGKDPRNWKQRVEALAAAFNLTIGDPERQALRARHDFAHAWPVDDRSLAWHVHIEATFRTLVHRVLLASLGYGGEYVDYSDRADRGTDPRTMGHPSRPLAEPAAGPKGDGRPAPDE
jgi:hypothetical protein